MGHFDIAIIGGGIAGVSAAYELAATGNVLLLEQEHQPGLHSTGRSAALLTESYGNVVIRALAAVSRRFFEQPPVGLFSQPLVRARPILWIAQAQDEDFLRGGYTSIHKTLSSLAWLSPAEALERCPCLRPEFVAAAMEEPNAMDLDVHELQTGLLREFRRRGGVLQVNSEVIGIDRHADRWVIRTANNEYPTDIVVNAAGAWCDKIARLAGAPELGIVPKRRTAIVFDAPKEHDTTRWPCVVEAHETFYFKPEARQLLASPGDETRMEACDVQPEELDIAVAVDRIEAATTLKIAKLNSTWAGLRSFAPDKGLVIGWDRVVPNFMWLAGQGGYGVMTSPAAASAVAALVRSNGFPSSLCGLGVTEQALSPSRFQT